MSGLACHERRTATFRNGKSGHSTICKDFKIRINILFASYFSIRKGAALGCSVTKITALLHCPSAAIEVAVYGYVFHVRLHKHDLPRRLRGHVVAHTIKSTVDLTFPVLRTHECSTEGKH